MVGIAQISGLFLGVLLLGFLFEFTQTYLMQWTGQKVMFDLRSQLYRHLQRMDIAFFDKNPVGRLVTRVTTDVDALNDMFTSGVVSIVEDVFVLAGDPRGHALDELAAGADRLHGAADHRHRHADLPQVGARQLPPDSRGHRAHQFLPPGARQRHHSSATVQPRAQVVRRIRGGKRPAHGGVQGRHPGLCALLPGSGDACPPSPLPACSGSADTACWRTLRQLGVLVAFMHVRPEIFPPHPGSEREVQHSAIGDGRRRANFQTA